tara:strand:+ start:3047 stop:3805 length:759 start_codon:yes stop_codon:yes gene_type:complete
MMRELLDKYGKLLNEQVDALVPMYVGFQNETGIQYPMYVSLGIAADSETAYGAGYSEENEQQSEELYNIFGQPSEGQFVKLLGPTYSNGAGVCFQYIGHYEWEGDVPQEYGSSVGYMPTPETEYAGPFNTLEECWNNETNDEDVCSNYPEDCCNKCNSNLDMSEDDYCYQFCSCCPEVETEGYNCRPGHIDGTSMCVPCPDNPNVPCEFESEQECIESGCETTTNDSYLLEPKKQKVDKPLKEEINRIKRLM